MEDGGVHMESWRGEIGTHLNKDPALTRRMASTDRQRWARLRPELAWKHPGLPTSWVPVLERNPEAMNPDPLRGDVWLDTPGKVLCVPAASRVPRSA